MRISHSTLTLNTYVSTIQAKEISILQQQGNKLAPHTSTEIFIVYSNTFSPNKLSNKN